MKRKFLRYVIPSVLAMWIYSIYTMINGIFVAKGVGEIALAAVNISQPFVNVTFAVAILFAVGTSTIASINLGNKESKKASEVFTMNLAILIGLCIIITMIVLFNVEKIAYFLGANGTTIEYVTDYLRIISLFCVFAVLSYYFEVLVKTDGHPQLATIVVLISAITNLFFVYLFVIKLGFGVKGAAFAVGFSQVSACMVYVWHFAKNSSDVKIVRFNFDFTLLRRTIPLGISDFVTELSTGFIIFMFNRIILKNIGEIGIVTYTVIMYVNTIVLMTMAGISQGTQPLVSYYYGRDDKQAYIYFLKIAAKSVGVISLVIYAVSMIFAEQINGLFINKEQTELLSYAVKAFRMYVSVYMIVGFNIILVGFYSAIEKPIYSMAISTGRGLVMIVASMFVMTELFGSDGVWLSSVVSEAVCLLMGLIIFARYYYGELFSESSTENLGNSINLKDFDY